MENLRTNWLPASLDWSYRLLRPWFFRQEAETVHGQMLALISRMGQSSTLLKLLKVTAQPSPESLKTEIWGQTLANPIGLAAGFDKDGRIYNPLFALGFGFVEIGTITPRPQPGNPKPRLFRLPEDKALINRLGFNNHGAEAVHQRLCQHPPQGVLGINLGKNKNTPLAQAVEDYERGLETLYNHADYLVINISSPNTEQLRSLQQEAELEKLLSRLVQARNRQAESSGRKVPMLVKLAPDWEDFALVQSLEVIRKQDVQGIVATNTTLARPALQSRHADETGGLSGCPLRARATEVIRMIRQTVGAELLIIGVGGVFSGADAYEKIRAGANLVQVYSALIYQGPGLVNHLKLELDRLLRRDGFCNAAAAVGVDC